MKWLGYPVLFLLYCGGVRWLGFEFRVSAFILGMFAGGWVVGALLTTWLRMHYQRPR